MFTALTLLAAAAWAGLLLAPPWPWRNRHYLAPMGPGDHDLGDITVLIPARDEAGMLPVTLAALARQGHGLLVVLVDDRSSDGTAEVARRSLPEGLTVLSGRPLPEGWSGKVWAQHQGEALLDRPYTLLLDADIELVPGMLAALRQQATRCNAALVSIMAQLGTATIWEKCLIPPFVLFFKLLYPFAWSNDPRRRVAAAAGGCVLLRTEVLREAGGFASLHDAIIDDCALASRIKGRGSRTWIGQSTGVISRRRYARLADIWNMVARTAYTQLGYSPALLLACSAIMVMMFLLPLVAMFSAGAGTVAGIFCVMCMAIVFTPTVRLLGLHPAWVLPLPGAALAYLLMTWTSALRYWRGERSAWRGRRYLRATVEHADE